MSSPVAAGDILKDDWDCLDVVIVDFSSVWEEASLTPQTFRFT